jgi:hypothetical protein
MAPRRSLLHSCRYLAQSSFLAIGRRLAALFASRPWGVLGSLGRSGQKGGLFLDVGARFVSHMTCVMGVVEIWPKRASSNGLMFAPV